MVVYSVANADREVTFNTRVPNTFLYLSLPTSPRPTAPTKKLRFKHPALSTVIIIIIIENVNMTKYKHICKKKNSNTNFLRDIIWPFEIISRSLTERCKF